MANPEIEWLLAQLRGVGIHGISVTSLLDQLKETFRLNDDQVEASWEALKVLEAVTASGGERLGVSPFRKLSYSDVLILNLGSRILRFDSSKMSGASNSTPITPSSTTSQPRPAMSLTPESPDNRAFEPNKPYQAQHDSKLKRGREEDVLHRPGQAPRLLSPNAIEQQSSKAYDEVSEEISGVPQKKQRSGPSTFNTLRYGHASTIQVSAAPHTSSTRVDDLEQATASDTIVRVSINTPGTENPSLKSQQSLVVSVKLPQLKDPDHLANSKDQWLLPFAQRRQADLVLIQRTTKRPARGLTGRTNQKRQKLHPPSEPTISLGIQSVESSAWGTAIAYLPNTETGTWSTQAQYSTSAVMPGESSTPNAERSKKASRPPARSAGTMLNDTLPVENNTPKKKNARGRPPKAQRQLSGLDGPQKNMANRSTSSKTSYTPRQTSPQPGLGSTQASEPAGSTGLSPQILAQSSHDNRTMHVGQTSPMYVRLHDAAAAQVGRPLLPSSGILPTVEQSSDNNPWRTNFPNQYFAAPAKPYRSLYADTSISTTSPYTHATNAEGPVNAPRKLTGYEQWGSATAHLHEQSSTLGRAGDDIVTMPNRNPSMAQRILSGGRTPSFSPPYKSPYTTPTMPKALVGNVSQAVGNPQPDFSSSLEQQVSALPGNFSIKDGNEVNEPSNTHHGVLASKSLEDPQSPVHDRSFLDQGQGHDQVSQDVPMRDVSEAPAQVTPSHSRSTAAGVATRNVSQKNDPLADAEYSRSASQPTVQRRNKRRLAPAPNIPDPAGAVDPPGLADSTGIDDKGGEQKIVPRSGRSAENAQRERSLAIADAIPTLGNPIQARLACIFEDYPGNLILWKDLSSLDFFASAQHPPELPFWSMRILDLPDVPTTAAPKSKVMQLRFSFIKDVSQRSEVMKCIFVYGHSDADKEAAAKMREQVELAMIREGLRVNQNYKRPDELKQAIEKPYHCVKCNGRWRNKNGLEYHLTKASLSCNPNWIPTNEPKRGRKSNKPNPSDVAQLPSQQDQAPGQDPEEPNAKRVRRATKKKVDTVDGYESAGTDNSIIRWAENTAQNSIGIASAIVTTTPKAPRQAGKIYKALNKESETLQKIIDSSEEVSDNLAPDLLLSTVPTLLMSQLPSLDDLVNQMSSESKLTEAICKEMLMSLIRANLNMFPSQKSLWFACVGLWLKKHPTTKVLPKSTLCNKSLDDLISERKLVTGSFSFMDRRSRHTTKDLVFIPGTEMEGPNCDTLKHLIQETHPRIYVPSHLAPSPRVLEILQSLAARAIVSRPSGVAGVPDDGDDFSTPVPHAKELGDDESSTDEYVSKGEVESAAESDDDAMMDDLLPEAAPKPRRKKGEKRIRNQALANIRIAEGLRRYHDKMKAQKAAAIGSSAKTPVKSRRRPQPQHSGSTQDPEQTWPTAPTFMPDLANGAWSVGLDMRISERVVKNPKVSHFAEPITYMQASNGAWTVRPFGHGVKPLICRPSRREGKNTGYEDHMRRTEETHRPLIYPTTSKNATLPPKPRRKYTRQPRASVDGIESEVDANDTMDWSPGVENMRSTRSGKRFSTELEQEIVVEMRKRRPDAVLNPGLDTLPPSFGLGASIYKGPDASTLKLPKRYFAITYTQAELANGDIGEENDCSWTVPNLTTANHVYQVRWNDSYAFTSRTLPYSDLVDDDAVPVAVLPNIQRSLREPITRKRKRILTPAEKERLSVITNCTRPQLALPGDFEGLFDRSEDAAAAFSVQVAPNEATKRSRNPPVMSTVDEQRLLLAVIAQKNLTGGLESSIDWVVIASIFKRYTPHHLTALWKKLIIGKEQFVTKLSTDFQETYGNAYERGEVTFDWDNILLNDWNAIIDWVQNNVAVLQGQPTELPASKEEIYEMYKVEDSIYNDSWREKFFDLNTAAYRRCRMAAEEPSVLPIREEERDASTLLFDCSIVRAIAMSPDTPEIKPLVDDSLAVLGNDRAEVARDVLIANKAIMHIAKGRGTPRRSWEITDMFWVPLRNKHIKDSQFLEAIAYKSMLDQKFRAGETDLEVNWIEDEGAIMVISSLQAAGQLFIEPIDPPMEKFGLTLDGSYETKNIPRARWVIRLRMTRTASYVFDDDNDALKAIVEAASQEVMEGNPPSFARLEMYPAWYDIRGELCQVVWKRVIVAVSQTVALRSGIDVDGLAKVFKPTLEAWELRVLMEWGTNYGLFVRLSEKVEGWTVSEWWWSAVGAICNLYPGGNI